MKRVCRVTFRGSSVHFGRFPTVLASSKVSPQVVCRCSLNGCLDLCGHIVDPTETREPRRISLESHQDDAVDLFSGAFPCLGKVPAGARGGPVNEKATLPFDTTVSIGLRADLEGETDDQLTKMFRATV